MAAASAEPQVIIGADGQSDAPHDSGPPAAAAYESGIGSSAGPSTNQTSWDWVEAWNEQSQKHVEENLYLNVLMPPYAFNSCMMMMMAGPPVGMPEMGSPQHIEWKAQCSHGMFEQNTAAAAARDASGAEKKRKWNRDVPAKQHICKEQTKDKEDTTPDQLKTTVMLKNIPDAYTREALVQMLNRVLDGKYRTKFDFAYLPFSFKTNKRLGYAFVNLIDHGTAEEFMRDLDGFTGEGFAERDSRKDEHYKAEVAWGETHGKAKHIQKYQNSPLMHEAVDEMHKPMIFNEFGEEAAWEPPTKKVHAPRQVQRAQKQNR